jgi:hypothetical protein
MDDFGNRRRPPDNADLPEPLDAECIHQAVRFIDEDDLDVMGVGVHRYVVFGDIRVHHPAGTVVDDGRLVQGHADAPDHAAHDLAVRGLGIEDAPAGDRTDDPGDPDHTQLKRTKRSTARHTRLRRFYLSARPLGCIIATGQRRRALDPQARSGTTAPIPLANDPSGRRGVVMLRSQLFHGDRRLERCAVNNADHVTPGTVGDFVSKIQEALVILDDAILTGTEVSDRRYGDSTAEAVLAYKTTRNIVNRSYQRTADNIVGIMTITRMDSDMAAMEGRIPDMIQQSRLAAFQRTFAAFMQVAGIGPPPPPRRSDPNLANRLRARGIAMSIFNNPNPDMDDIGDTLGDMKNRIASPNTPFERGHFPDPRCGSRSGFVVGNRIPIFLCPRFFGGSDEQRIRTIVHESAHLTGIGDPDGEAYYLMFNSQNEDPQIVQGTPRSHNRAGFADTWAKYVNAITRQPEDR